MRRLTCLILAGVMVACSRPGTPPENITIEQAWSLTGLANPESAALSVDGSFLYVSNVNGEGEAKDGNGFISRVSTDGRILTREWAIGLDGPKGVALHDNLLYVSDIDRVVVVDATTGQVGQSIAIPGAQFLNDIAVLPDGVVLVADSGLGRINEVRANAVQTWLDDPLLDSINGLLPEQDRLVVTTMQGRLLSVNYRTKAITVLAEGLGDADGAAALGGGRYLVSEWPGIMHVVFADGTHETILDTRAESRFLNDFLLVGDMLYVPNWEPSAITAYRVSGVR